MASVEFLFLVYYYLVVNILNSTPRTEETRRKKETTESDKIQISELKSDTKGLNPIFHGNEKLKNVLNQNSGSEHHQKQVVNQNLAIRQHQTQDIHQNPAHGQHQTHHINQNLGHKQHQTHTPNQNLRHGHHQTQVLNQNHIHGPHQPQVLKKNHGRRAHQTPAGKYQKLVHVQHQTQDLYQNHRNGHNQPLVSKLDSLSSPDPTPRVLQRGEPLRLYSRIQNHKPGLHKPSPVLKKNTRKIPGTVGRRNIQSWRNSSQNFGRRSGRELVPGPELALGLSTLILGSILAV